MAGQYRLVKATILGWLLAVFLLPMVVESRNSTMQTLLLSLQDGAYQLCTEPDPQDWRDGSGVCLNMLKQGATIDGYYGYPHSSSFVCLRGQVAEDWLRGQGLIISWPGQPWQDIPQEFLWDYPEERLFLSQGALARSEGTGEEHISWTIFQTARLNMQGMYLYNTSRMTPPAQLCDWSST